MELGAAQSGTTPGRYRALHTVSSIFKIVAWAIAILGTLAVIGAAVTAGSSDEGGSGEALAILVVGGISVALYALFAFAAAEMIKLAIAIEENTRRAADSISTRDL